MVGVVVAQVVVTTTTSMIVVMEVMHGGDCRYSCGDDDSGGGDGSNDADDYDERWLLVMVVVTTITMAMALATVMVVTTTMTSAATATLSLQTTSSISSPRLASRRTTFGGVNRALIFSWIFKLPPPPSHVPKAVNDSEHYSSNNSHHGVNGWRASALSPLPYKAVTCVSFWGMYNTDRLWNWLPSRDSRLSFGFVFLLPFHAYKNFLLPFHQLTREQ